MILPPLSSATSNLAWWVSGFAVGFQLWYKLPKRIREVLVLLMLLGGVAIGAGLFGHRTSLAPQSRSLGWVVVPPSHPMLPPANQTTADALNGNGATHLQLPAQKKMPVIATAGSSFPAITTGFTVNSLNSVPAGTTAGFMVTCASTGPPTQGTCVASNGTWFAAGVTIGQSGAFVIPSTAAVTMTTSATSAGSWVTTSMTPSQQLAQIPGMQKVGGRKGPFCRVQCAVHHGALYDAETEPNLCQQDRIPLSMTTVPGWITNWIDENGQSWEYLNTWPGPASYDEGPRESFKTYRKGQ